ncbi:MAG: 16S rRNA (guanine(966)-N(2))-methyltransferase RsmD [Clostridia bacterium]|nr:16S rRNA (guanine(966)-N(2))-methyltransferase RsmD [Clostridia bacterium]
MRIITGSAKGKALLTLEGEDTTRPTGAKVKEAVFSAVQFDTEGRRFLDLFAGSGQMGLEALSRGAAAATFIDASPEAMAVVKANAERTGLSDKCRFSVSDFRNFLRKAKGKEPPYDLVFIDPPYALRWCEEALRRTTEAGLAKAGTLFILESEEENVLTETTVRQEGLTLLKEKKYGRTYVHIYRKETP